MGTDKLVFVFNYFWSLEEWFEKLPNNISGIQVLSREYARKLFTENEHCVNLIVIGDKYADKTTRIETLLFVKEIREKFTGPMIAMSNSSTHTMQLMDAGCDHVAETDIAKQILKLLGI